MTSKHEIEATMKQDEDVEEDVLEAEFEEVDNDDEFFSFSNKKKTPPFPEINLK